MSGIGDKQWIDDWNKSIHPHEEEQSGQESGKTAKGKKIYVGIEPSTEKFHAGSKENYTKPHRVVFEVLYKARQTQDSLSSKDLKDLIDSSKAYLQSYGIKPNALKSGIYSLALNIFGMHLSKAGSARRSLEELDKLYQAKLKKESQQPAFEAPSVETSKPKTLSETLVSSSKDFFDQKDLLQCNSQLIELKNHLKEELTSSLKMLDDDLSVNALLVNDDYTAILKNLTKLSITLSKCHPNLSNFDEIKKQLEKPFQELENNLSKFESKVQQIKDAKSKPLSPPQEKEPSYALEPKIFTIVDGLFIKDSKHLNLYDLSNKLGELNEKIANESDCCTSELKDDTRREVLLATNSIRDETKNILVTIRDLFLMLIDLNQPGSNSEEIKNTFNLTVQELQTNIQNFEQAVKIANTLTKKSM